MGSKTTPSAFKRVFIGDDDGYATQVPDEDLLHVAGRYGPILRVTSTSDADYVSFASHGRVDVRIFGAAGDGITDDTAAIARAIDEIRLGGGILYFPAGTYLISSTLFLPSGTTVMGDGPATILYAVRGTGWVLNTPGSSAYSYGNFRVLFANANWDADTITDENFVFMNFSADLDGADSVERKALARMVSCRNTEFTAITTKGGGSVIEHIHTENSNIHDCRFFDCHGSACDHYSGFKDAWVTNCYVRQTAISSNNPAIQFTGTNNNNTNNTSDGVVCTGNRVLCTGGMLSNVGGISITASGAGGTVNNALIANNDVDMDGLTAGGILCYGGGDNWKITGNSVRNINDYNCIFVLPNGYGTVSRVHVADNRVFDSTRLSVSGRIITVEADGSTVIDNDILGCECTTGVYLEGDDSVLRIGSLHGTAYTNAYQVLGTVTVDGEITGTWTPEIQFGGATTGITYASRTATYTRQGSLTYVEAYIVLSSKGSATGQALIFGLPFPDVTGSTPPSRLMPSIADNTNGLTEEPYIFVSDDAIVLRTGTFGGSNLNETNFKNNTIIAFSGWYRVG